MHNENDERYPESETTKIQSHDELMTVLGDDALVQVKGGCGGGGGGKGGGKKKKKKK